MANRTCGIVYYANGLTVITKTGERVDIGRTEIMLVRENDQPEPGTLTTKEWIAVIPVDRNDRSDQLTDLQWLKTATETESTAVRFVRVDASPHEMRLTQTRPTTWGGRTRFVGLPIVHDPGHSADDPEEPRPDPPAASALSGAARRAPLR